MIIKCPHCNNDIDILQSVYANAQVRQREFDRKYDEQDKRDVNRCTSANSRGIQCGLPLGHIGKHGNGIAILSWE